MLSFHHATASDDNLVLYSTPMGENTVAVLAPGTAAGKSGAVVTNVGQPRTTAGLVRRPLLDANGGVAPAAPEIYAPYPMTAQQRNATDNQMLRLADGTLLAIKNGYLWSDVANPPPWFGQVSIDLSDDPVQQNLDNVRNGIFVFASTDGGNVWTTRSVLDSAVIGGGKYGWPQPDTSQPFWVGGFDRTEAYCDPWSGNLFLAAWAKGGPFTLNGVTTKNWAGVVFRSKDNGVTWKLLAEKFGTATDYQMTSTPGYELIVFRNSGQGPWLQLLKRGATELDDGRSVTIIADGAKVPLGTDAAVQDLGASPFAVARGGAGDEVLIAYPTTTANGRQEYAVGLVSIGPEGKVGVSSRHKVSAASPSRSCLLGAFVEDLEPDKAKEPAPVLFYWIDAAPKTSTTSDELRARGLVFDGDWESKVLDLSVAGGASRAFGRLWIGHYFHGAAFRQGDEYKFLAQWGEPDAIRGSIVSARRYTIPFRPIERRPSDQRAVDPLSLALASHVYLLLTLPDPPPIDVILDALTRQGALGGRGERADLRRRLGEVSKQIDELQRLLR